MSSRHRLIAVVASLAAVSCTAGAGAAKTRQNPAWMVGKWGWVSVPEEPRLAGQCSEEAEFYRRDGYVVDGQGTARWWIEGDTLVRAQIGEAYGENRDGTIYRNRFTRVAPGELLFEGDDATQKLVRCGDVPREWDSYPVK